MISLRKSVNLTLLALLFFSASYCIAQAPPLTLHRAVDLAVKKSATAVIADMDQKIAELGVDQVKDLFLPQLNAGSGIGYTRGFPLTLEGSAPALFNLNSQQTVFNATLLSSLRAAKSDAKAAAMSADEKKSLVALETVQVYMELAKISSTHDSLIQLEAAAARVEKVAQDRFNAGVDSQSDLARAKLTAARARLLIAQEQTKKDALTQRLSQLTGLPPEQVIVDPTSIPALSELAFDNDVSTKALASSNSLKAMQEHTMALELRAQAEHRAMLPTFDFVTQYAVLANYQHYQDYFTHPFMRNNVTTGVVIRFPFLNFTQKARAESADLETVKAKREVEAAKQQVSNETLRLRNLVRQLASADADALATRVESAQATQRDLESARLLEAQKKTALVDAQFNLDKARLEMMRATGELSAWYNSGPQ